MANNISLERAIAMTGIFRAAREIVLAEEYQGRDVLPYCETFDKAAFERLINHPDCVKIRIYCGMNEDMQLRSIVVAVDENDKDIIPEMDPEEENEGIVEEGNPCPPVCPPESDLYP